MNWHEIGGWVASALGVGGLARVIGKMVDGRKAKTRADADVATRALDSLDKEREETGRHVDGLVACERRCATLERQVGELTAVVEGMRRERDDLRLERDALNRRVRTLEDQVAWMQHAIEAMMDGDRASAAVATVTPIGRVKETM